MADSMKRLEKALYFAKIYFESAVDAALFRVAILPIIVTIED